MRRTGSSCVGSAMISLQIFTSTTSVLTALSQGNKSSPQSERDMHGRISAMLFMCPVLDRLVTDECVCLARDPSNSTRAPALWRTEASVSHAPFPPGPSSPWLFSSRDGVLPSIDPASEGSYCARRGADSSSASASESCPFRFCLKPLCLKSAGALCVCRAVAALVGSVHAVAACVKACSRRRHMPCCSGDHLCGRIAGICAVLAAASHSLTAVRPPGECNASTLRGRRRGGSSQLILRTGIGVTARRPAGTRPGLPSAARHPMCALDSNPCNLVPDCMVPNSWYGEKSNFSY
jgi:hypothetical protein